MSAHTSLHNRAAVLLTPGSALTVQSRCIPTPGPGQLLLRTCYVAINPADWMMQQSKTQQQLPCILGSDVAGTVEAIGSHQHSSHHFQVGNRVVAFTGGQWSGNMDEGAFQEYVLVSASSTARIPPSLPLLEAAALPMASATAASALWATLGISRPSLDRDTTRTLDYKDRGILIYGASAAVGISAVQMAARMGFQVFAVASSKHKEYLCSLGVQHFVSRQGSGMGEKVAVAVSKAALKEPLRLALDAVSSKESLIATLQCLASCSKVQQGARAKLATTLDWPQDLEKPGNVDVERTSASHFHVKEDNSQWLFHQYLEKSLEHGTIIPGPPVRLIEGGLEGASEALSVCKGGLSCEKLVLRLS